MAANSKIAWCHDTINFWWGCQKVAPGCTDCYALAIALRFYGDLWGPTKPRLVIESAGDALRALDRKAARTGERRRVFVNSMSDFFEDFEGAIVNRQKEVVAGNLNALRDTAYRLFRDCRNLDFLLLTKRPENISRMWPGGFYENVWLGTSISNQATADEFVPRLLESRDLVPVLFLSAEPLLGSIDCQLPWIRHADGTIEKTSAIDQIIIGIESAGKRVGRLGDFASESDWCDGAQSIVRQCAEAGVAAFVKQVPVNGHVSHDPADWRESLRVRQFPEPANA